MSRSVPSRVVVDGAVVRRRVGPWTAGVHDLLERLAAAGFDGAPRIVGLGPDYEVVSWVPGTVGERPLTEAVRSDAALASVARLLRRFHDAARGMCHGDIGPWNVVFEGTEAVGLIDWDLSGAGSWWDDVAAAIWHFAPLYDDAECVRVGWPSPPDRVARVRIFLAAYGRSLDGEALRRVIEQRQASYLAAVRAAHADPTAPGAEPWLKVDPGLVERDMAFLEQVALP
ncbi:MAG TPA: phosphotransferase [Acidimicrobiales bacterium]|nr:phosphotransferase [Acidimicrobiales bacterium]